jgi:phosphohistidine phosphatase
MCAADDGGLSAEAPMNLILWRHAEAEDAEPDLDRRLTGRGRKQAQRMAEWLVPRLPERFAVIASPAQRTRQTADALGCEYKVDRRLAPDADVAHALAAIEWPEGPRDAAGTVVVVGHQPTLGRLASLLLAGQEMGWSVRKGAIWWLSTRDRDDRRQLVLRTVLSPEQL